MVFAEKVVGKSDKGVTVILQHCPRKVRFYGKYDQCCSDVVIIHRVAGQPDEMRHPWAKRGGKNGRYDLVCNLPGWKKDSYYCRVLGWYFLNKRHLSWKEYNSKEKVGKLWRYAWQVNHKKAPEDCCLSNLELGSAQDNADDYAETAKERYNSVWRRPAMKRPPSAA